MNNKIINKKIAIIFAIILSLSFVFSLRPFNVYSDDEFADLKTEESEDIEDINNDLVSKIQNCNDIDALYAILDDLSSEEKEKLSEKEETIINDKLTTLEPSPAPSIVIEETDNKTVQSEIIYQTVNYIDVAPLKKNS